MGPKKRATASAPAPLIPGEYVHMLREFNRENKRLRKNGTVAKASASPSHVDIPAQSEISPKPKVNAEQLVPSTYDTIHHLPESDFDSDEFEDVQLENSDPEETSSPKVDNEDLVLSFNSEQASKLSRGPKMQGLLKPKRLLLHKISLATWLFHARLRNRWLLNKELLNNPILTTLLPDIVLKELYPPDHLTPFLKSKRFVDGLRHAMEVWQSKFHVVRPGLASVQTQDDARGDSGIMEEYLSQILSLRGSLDLEGQGFVALLRSNGLEVRLVSSLQPPDNLTSDIHTPNQRALSTSSGYPIFWSEVWDPHVNRWVSLDSVTSTVRLPTRNKMKLKLEPPLSDRLNILRYCIALNSQNFVRDVTRRYSSCFNSRTRKKRLSHFESDGWFVRFLGKFANRKPTSFDKDEILELSRYPRLEGIPTKVQDFVGHPEYALVEQLRQNEVLRLGAKPCGILSKKAKGLNALKKLPEGKPSYIFSRSDVLTARSSQSWYRHGRSIKLGSHPQTRIDRTNKLTGEAVSVALYTYEQTELYKPPPIGADGIVPKSQFRTIDVFHKTMIPMGGTYIESSHGTRAAKLLKIDFANVVTSVKFGKSGPRSNMFGVVVASQFAPAMHAVISGLHDMESELAEKFEDVRILGIWRKFIMGTQIWERVEKMNPAYLDVSRDHNDDVHSIGDDQAELGNTSENNVSETKTQDNISDSPITSKPRDESDLEIVNEYRLVPKCSGRTKHLRFSDAALQAVRTRVISSGLVDDDTMMVHGASNGEGVNDVNAQVQPYLLNNHSQDSPESYHSFSDLDVDEISESDL